MRNTLLNVMSGLIAPLESSFHPGEVGSSQNRTKTRKTLGPARTNFSCRLSNHKACPYDDSASSNSIIEPIRHLVSGSSVVKKLALANFPIFTGLRWENFFLCPSINPVRSNSCNIAVRWYRIGFQTCHVHWGSTGNSHFSDIQWHNALGYGSEGFSTRIHFLG